MTLKLGSKYYPLFQWLQACDRPSVTLTFTAIEDRLGTTLPPSARRQRAWWSNRDSDRALQAGAWVGAGYHVETVDLAAETVTFQQFTATYVIERQDGTIVWNQNAIRALRKTMGLTQAQFAEELGVRRQTVSEWENGVYEPERSTAKHLQRIADQSAFEDVPAIEDWKRVNPWGRIKG
jgi:DNA-binding XRE family transcriptional regulator